MTAARTLESAGPRPKLATILSYPPPPGTGSVLPPPSSVVLARQAYVTQPPIIRERMPTVDLADDDILEATPIPALPPPDPIQSLFALLPDDSSSDSAWQVASNCASALANALGARAALIHSFNLRTRELRIIGVFGLRTSDLLGRTVANDEDVVVSTLLRTERSMTLAVDPANRHLISVRAAMVGATSAMVAVPVMNSSAPVVSVRGSTDGNTPICVGMIEVFDVAKHYLDRAQAICRLVGEHVEGHLSALSLAV